MKKIIRVLALTLAFAVLCGSFATIAYARELEPCYHCNTTGEFPVFAIHGITGVYSVTATAMALVKNLCLDGESRKCHNESETDNK